MTAVLRIEHSVADFARWRQAFDSDPVGRERGGVRRYRIMHASEDENYVLIDLEFDTTNAATAFLAGLQQIWTRVDVIGDPGARVVELTADRVLATDPAAA
jgi:hypothetical protein